MNGETIEVSTLIALGGLVLTLLALVGGLLYRQGKIEGKVDLLIEDGKEFRNETRGLREELRQELRDMREELRQELRDMRADFGRELSEMRQENRYNHQQLLQAFAHHSHDQDTGFAIFRIPPGSENPAS